MSPRGARAGPPAVPTEVGRASTDLVLARARWAGIALVALQVMLYTPPEGVLVPLSLWWGAVPAAMLALSNLAMHLGRWTGQPAGHWRLVGLVLDALAVLVLIGLFAFDPTSALWTLMMLPVAEAALRGWPRRSMAVVAVLAVGYVGLRWFAEVVWLAPVLAVDSLTYRVGLVSIMAVIVAGMSRRLELQIAETAASQADAAQLRAVANAARLMSELDLATVVREVTSAARGMGFTEAWIWLDDRGGRVPDGTVACTALGGPGEFDRIAEATRATGWVRLDGEDSPVALAPGEVLVVAGVAVDGEVGALLAATHQGPAGGRDLDGLALLATQAGAALTNASRYAEGRALEERLAHQATHDSLTGLPNRVLLGGSCGPRCAEDVAAGSVLGVIFLDLDRFKQVNDALGHATGDELLRQAAARIVALIGPADMCARVGGDEFVVVSGGHGSDLALLDMAHRLRAALHAPFLVDELLLDVEVSIGVAWTPDDGSDLDTLVQHADLAMAQAKSARAGIACFRDIRGAISPTDLGMLGDLRRALDDEQQLDVHYQPIVDLAQDRTVGVEALFRWNHPVRGSVPPSAFIPAAEETSLIHRLTDHVLDRALATLAGWIASGRPVRMSVNLSPRALVDPSLIARVDGALQRHGVPPGLLCLEITEETLVDDPDRAIATMHRLKDLGVLLSIDDFGTGYSSMSYLKHLPVDEIKIDRGFVTDMVASSRDRALVHAVVDLAHRLELHVVAEGIETVEVLEVLREIGCDMAQGYYLGRPVAAQAADLRLADELAARVEVPRPR